MRLRDHGSIVTQDSEIFLLKHDIPRFELNFASLFKFTTTTPNSFIKLLLLCIYMFICDSLIDLFPQTHLPDHQYVFTRLNLLLDHMAATDTLTHAVSNPSAITTTSGVILNSSSAHAIGGGAICLAEAGVFASASLVAFRGKKEVELNELCVSLLNKLPKVWNKVNNVITGIAYVILVQYVKFLKNIDTKMNTYSI